LSALKSVVMSLRLSAKFRIQHCNCLHIRARSISTPRQKQEGWSGRVG
jgi:hypothetical protein